MATTSIPWTEQDRDRVVSYRHGRGRRSRGCAARHRYPGGVPPRRIVRPGRIPIAAAVRVPRRETGLLILAGALLFLVSLFFYRRGFALLRKVDSRFAVASILCWIGTLGFLLVVVAAIVIVGSSSSLLSCVNGQPTHALTCLRSGEPLGAYTGLVGFWMGWLGGVGIVLGLSAGSSRFKTREIALGAALYAVLLLALVGPFVSLIVSFHGVEYLLVLVPFLSVLAPFFVFRGTDRDRAEGAAAPSAS